MTGQTSANFNFSDMNPYDDKINRLNDRLGLLLKRQEAFIKEINQIREELSVLQAAGPEGKKPVMMQDQIVPPPENEKKQGVAVAGPQDEKIPPPPSTLKEPPVKKDSRIRSDLERFIGENLINKIGIIITIIGVAIGAKYAIDRNLISPIVRIISGYLAGAVLFGFAFRLKKKYENFSAVLLSGSLAIGYFITFFAYSLYGFLPLIPAFVLMVMFTVYSVFSSLQYNRQVIAHLGLVGAYAVPFLISRDPGNVTVLFSYMTIINIGILIIAFKKYWKALYYSSFGITWFIFILTYVAAYKPGIGSTAELSFLTIFFIIFYGTFIVCKLEWKENFATSDIILLLLNPFIYYTLGYAILNDHETGNKLLGLFTVFNAFIHFIAAAFIYSRKDADRNLFYFAIGLAVVFVTIAIPVQLDGNRVTLLWTGEAALLFWIGRTKHTSLYEIISYILIILAFFSILNDWMTGYKPYFPQEIKPDFISLVNIHFLTSVFFIFSMGFIYIIDRNKSHTSPLVNRQELYKVVSFSIPAVFLFALYFSLRMEIMTSWNQLYAKSLHIISEGGQATPVNYYNGDFLLFKTVWTINYTLLFVTALSYINIRKFKNRDLGIVNLCLNVLVIAAFLIDGLYAMSELRASYLSHELQEYYNRGMMNIMIRYVSYAFVASTLIACYHYIRFDIVKKDLKIAYDILLFTSLIWIASSELINWLDIAGVSQTHKLGLSLLWGISSLLLIALGIRKNKKHLRIGAIALFGITLIKLFFYDISHLNTIAKTIIFVSLGVLLLIISFLYHKYKHIIFDNP